MTLYCFTMSIVMLCGKVSLWGTYSVCQKVAESHQVPLHNRLNYWICVFENCRFGNSSSIDRFGPGLMVKRAAHCPESVRMVFFGRSACPVPAESKDDCSVSVSIRLSLHLEPSVAIVNMERESPMLKSSCSYPRLADVSSRGF